MTFIRNALAIIGVSAMLLLLLGAAENGDLSKALDGLDPGARAVYTQMARILAKTGSAAEATVWKMPVDAGLSPEDVEAGMKSAAVERNILNVGELPLSKQVAASTGKPYRFVKIYMYCNAQTAARMIDYDPAFAAYLPCRITLVEDPQGRLWLYTLNMDLMIHSGKPLPPALHDEAVQVKEAILAIMKRGAAGAF